MNDALRKKEREGSGDKPFTDVFASPPAKRKARKWFILLAVPVVLAVFILASMAFLRHRVNDPLLAGHPPVKMAKPEANQAVSKRPMPAPSAPSATSTGAPSGGPQVSRPPLDGPPPEPKIEEALQGRHPTPSLPNKTVGEATASVDTKSSVQSPKPPMEEKQPKPEKASSQHPKGFEPGPISVANAQPATAAKAPEPPPAAKPVSKARQVAAKPTKTNKKEAPSRHSGADLFYRKAVACHRSGRLTEAARFYRSALASNANHRQAMANLATVYIELKSNDQALPLLEHLEKVTPIPDGVLLNLAIAAMDRQEFEKALAYLDRAQMAQNAPAWQIRFHRAAAFSHLNRLPEALTLYKKVETERPDDYRVKFNLALAHDALGDYPQALDYYGRLLKGKDPETKKDRQAIISRVGVLRRYLNQSQSQ